jgi:hypothetical protein
MLGFVPHPNLPCWQMIDALRLSILHTLSLYAKGTKVTLKRKLDNISSYVAIWLVLFGVGFKTDYEHIGMWLLSCFARALELLYGVVILPALALFCYFCCIFILALLNCKIDPKTIFSKTFEYTFPWVIFIYAIFGHDINPKFF